MVPCNLACAKIPKIGMNTAVIKKPIVTQLHKFPAFFPKKGGRIKFPAPKNIENKANPVMYISLVLFIFVYFSNYENDEIYDYI